MTLKIELNRDELRAIQFPIIVETYQRIMRSNSTKRKYKDAFTFNERETIRRYYQLFSDWHLKTGVPDKYTMFPETLVLIRRAIDFFATV